MYNNFVELDEWSQCFASGWLYDSSYDVELEIGSSTGEFLCAMAAKDTYRIFYQKNALLRPSLLALCD